ncbi:MAG: NTP transferase domain-containing protein [Lutibacter sp.]|uniref:nucleotidyltransferase family protein n=1 Tax=Lutibacter sp. TaxID=1925666 RepID=UPI003858AF13
MKNNTVFVLLAGGKSKRMGVDKGLLKYHQTFWILEQLNNISKTPVSEVYIGLGYNYKNYFNAIPWFEDALTNFIDFQELKIKVIINKNPELGSFSTLQTILKKIDTSKNIILNHIDVPLLNSEEFQKIMEIKNIVVIPNYEGKNGHPIKMKSKFWKQLIHLNPSNEEARLDFQIMKLQSIEITTISVNDAAVIKNLNTTSDWISFLKNTN